MKTSTNRLKVSSLTIENQQYRETDGVSAANRCFGFIPGFLNTHSGDVYLSCFSNGQPAPVHLFDGLPGHVVQKSIVTGRAYALQDGVISGFILNRRFYTREEACLAVTSSRC